MTVLSMTHKLLSFVLMFQAHMKYLSRKSIYQKDMGDPYAIDWFTVLHDWYMDYDDIELQVLGLAKNQYAFDALMNFRVTDEIMRTDRKDLKKLTFRY